MCVLKESIPMAMVTVKQLLMINTIKPYILAQKQVTVRLANWQVGMLLMRFTGLNY